MAKMNNFSTTTETLPKSGHVTEGKLCKITCPLSTSKSLFAFILPNVSHF
ncbi:hypothetical protein FF38_05506 [Lucilia cuprina]|uniref:Uncharacterized protein n=1 Tax=Lucilia cuprina TaxID=7375 RepID=A0A0L0CET9_LUCCU|nr:hypothetical protein FF38_05506 [Lucilia cuprina]